MCGEVPTFQYLDDCSFRIARCKGVDLDCDFEARGQSDEESSRYALSHVVLGDLPPFSAR